VIGRLRDTDKACGGRELLLHCGRRGRCHGNGATDVVGAFWRAWQGAHRSVPQLGGQASVLDPIHHGQEHVSRREEALGGQRRAFVQTDARRISQEPAPVESKVVALIPGVARAEWDTACVRWYRLVTLQSCAVHSRQLLSEDRPLRDLPESARQAVRPIGGHEAEPRSRRSMLLRGLICSTSRAT
jgi:hypothetical protein